VPLGPYGRARGIAQGGGQKRTAVGRGQSLAGDTQLGLGLHGEFEAYEPGRAVDRTAELESAPAFTVGACGERHIRSGAARLRTEDLSERLAAAEPGKRFIRLQDAGLAAAAAARQQSDGGEGHCAVAQRAEGGHPQLGHRGGGQLARGIGLFGGGRGGSRWGVARDVHVPDRMQRFAAEPFRLGRNPSNERRPLR
jgi:hypothetical protein